MALAAAAAALARRAPRQMLSTGLARALAQGSARQHVQAHGAASQPAADFSSAAGASAHVLPTSCSTSSAAAAGALAASLTASPSSCLPCQALQQLQQQRGYAVPRGRRPAQHQQKPMQNLPLRNSQIKAAEVRVVFPPEDCKPTTVMPLAEAMREAQVRELDVVMVSPQAVPPVVRLVPWDKVLYQLQKKEKEARRQLRTQQQLAQPKEVRIGCHIAEHDLEFKLGQARSFLSEGHYLRLVVTFSGGREIQLGQEVTYYLLGQLEDVAEVRSPDWHKRAQMNQWVVQLSPRAKPSSKKTQKIAAGAADANAAA